MTAAPVKAIRYGAAAGENKSALGRNARTPQIGPGYLVPCPGHDLPRGDDSPPLRRRASGDADAGAQRRNVRAPKFATRGLTAGVDGTTVPYGS
jgi:hypothetical protein